MMTFDHFFLKNPYCLTTHESISHGEFKNINLMMLNYEYIEIDGQRLK